MSVARHLHTPPQPRTEADVAADAIVAILDARIVPFTPGMIGRLSMATGVSVAMIKKGWELKDSGYGGLRPTRRPVAEQPAGPVVTRKTPEPRYAPNYNGNTRAANERARSKKEPVPGKRLCSRCGELKPKNEFNMSNPRTGKLRPECRSCTAAYHRERYLSVEQTKRLKTLLRFVVCEEDHLEADCITCHLPIEIGQELSPTT
jgi:hypothetical protein